MKWYNEIPSIDDDETDNNTGDNQTNVREFFDALDKSREELDLPDDYQIWVDAWVDAGGDVVDAWDKSVEDLETWYQNHTDD